MKVPYLEILHAKVEIYSSNSMPVREILGFVRLEYKQIRKIRTSTGSVQSWPKGYCFAVFEISAAELLHTCCRDSAHHLLTYCRGSAESPIDAKYQI